jgi:hypothetical protein
MVKRIIKRLFCKHEYINVKTIYKDTDQGRAKGTRDECLKCGKVKLNAVFLD